MIKAKEKEPSQENAKSPDNPTSTEKTKPTEKEKHINEIDPLPKYKIDYQKIRDILNYNVKRLNEYSKEEWLIFEK